MTGKLLVVGCGLIGGSVAAAASAAGWQVGVWDQDPLVAQAACAQRIAHFAAPDLGTGVMSADLVVLAVPTLAVADVALDLARVLGPQGRPDLVVTDAASVKGSVLTAVAEAFGEVPAWFVPGHPIAGSERSGVAAADATLFQAHKVILTPVAATSPTALARVRAFWQQLGAEVLTMAVADHDRVLAMTSHLPHMLAFALVDTLAAEPDHEQIFSLAAGGFRDFSRIASSNPRMWHDIALANGPALTATLDRLLAALGQIRNQVAAADGPALMAMMERARSARDVHVLGKPATTDNTGQP